MFKSRSSRRLLSIAIASIMFCSAAAAMECSPPIKRAADGHIVRSSWQIIKFKKAVACPATGNVQVGSKYTPCRGYVVDHVVPLCACGLDRPSNMQWQKKDASLTKDIEEKKLCGGKGD